MTEGPTKAADLSSKRPRPFSRLHLGLLCLVVIAAASVRGWTLHQTSSDFPLASDARLYATLALNLHRHGRYVTSSAPDTSPSYWLPPGYPTFLYAIMTVGGHEIASEQSAKRFVNHVRIAQSVLGTLTVAMVFLIGASFMSHWMATMGALLVAFAPHLLAFEFFLLTETLFTFLMTAALLATARGILSGSTLLFAVAGLCFGASALVRPAIVLFPVLIALTCYCLHRGKRLVPAVTLLAGVVLLNGGWVAWTRINGDDSHRSLLANAIAFGMYPDLTHSDPGKRGHPYNDDPEWGDFANSVARTIEELLERASADPKRYLRWYLVGKARVFWGPRLIVSGTRNHPVLVYPVTRSPFYPGGALVPLQDLYLGMHAYLLLVSIGGLVVLVATSRSPNMDGRRTRVAWVLAGALIYATLVHAALAPLPRYSIPFRVPLFLFFAFSLQLLWQWHGISRETLSSLLAVIRAGR